MRTSLDRSMLNLVIVKCERTVFKIFFKNVITSDNEDVAWQR